MVWLVKLNRRRRNWLNTGSINQTETLKCQRTWNIFILNSQTYTLPRPQGPLGCCCCFLLFHSFSPGWSQTMLPTSVLAYSALLTCHPSAVIPHLPIITDYYPQWSLLPCWIVVLTCVSVDPAWLVSSLCFLVLLPNLFFLCSLPYPYLLLLPCGPWVGVSECEWTFLDWIWRFCDPWTVWRGVWRFPCPGHSPLRFPGAAFPCCCIYFTWCASVNKPLSLFTSFESCT